jgi:spermidine synthase
MNGLHLIGDLSDCRCDPQLLLDGKRFETVCVEMVRASGLAVMDARFHQFEGSGFTGAVVLAESHLAIHTWPELDAATFDLYVCNHSQDNRASAETAYAILRAEMQPQQVVRRDVQRGNPASGRPGTLAATAASERKQ